MTVARRQSWQPARLLAVACVVVILGGLTGALVADRVLVAQGRPELVGLQGASWGMLVAVLSSLVTGAVIAWSRPEHPVGWLFLALCGAMMLSGVLDTYLTFSLRIPADPGAVPRLLAVLSSASFIWWLILVALILHLTPTGSPLPGQWAWFPRATVICGVVGFVSTWISPMELERPYQDVANPAARPDIAQWTDPVGYAAISFVALSICVGALSVVVRFRRSTGDERRQLLWLLLAIVPMPVFVVGAFVAAGTGHKDLMLWMSYGFILLFPAAAGLSVMRFQLYNVERWVSRVLSYSLLTAALLAIYALVVFMGTRVSGALAPSPFVSATLGAVTAAVLAEPMRRGLQRAVDRRFNRRRFNAETVVRRALAELDAGADLEQIFRGALDDPSLLIAYPGEENASWVDAEGRSVVTDGALVDVERAGRVVARVGFDPRLSDALTVQAVADLAAAELDNVRLRAELARRVTDVTDSRRRIASAQRDERRRIERDLHDGAQQSLLALAIDLQAANLAPDEQRWKDALGRGAESARSAVRQLRDLANGLHPAALADGGLPMALQDLGTRSHVPVQLDVEVPRLSPALEFTAWLVASEAVVNAQKHAEAGAIGIVARIADQHLVLRVEDDGKGGARAEGSGLRGLRDRVEAAGGELRLTSDSRGTTLEVRIPCGS